MRLINFTNNTPACSRLRRRPGPDAALKILTHLLVIAVLLFVATTASAATNTVTSTADTGAGTLRNLVASAGPGDTITFTNTLSGQTITLGGTEIVLNKNLTIDGSGLASQIRINGNHDSRIFHVSGDNVTLNSLVVTNGYSGLDYGGGIYHASGSLVLANCSVIGNSNASFGGGIASVSAMVLNNCTVADNVAAIGGGIFNQSLLTMNNSTLANNSANSGGGGIDNLDTLILNNSTLAHNSAGNSGAGGIYNDGTLTVNNSTLANNHASRGGGIYNDYGTLNLTNSIVCGNTASSFGPNIYHKAAYNVGTSLVDTNALLAPLGNYGGPTQTMPPLPGSPAIDGCTNGTIFATDQRGGARVFGSFGDIGAVEGVFNPSFPINPAREGNGSFQFNFTNLSGAHFTVWGSTNVALPFAQWSNLGAPVESPAGTFTFTDPQATNNAQRFYRVGSP